MNDDALVTMAMLSELLEMGVRVGEGMGAMGEAAGGLAEFLQSVPVELAPAVNAKFARALEAMDALKSDCIAFVRVANAFTAHHSPAGSHAEMN